MCKMKPPDSTVVHSGRITAFKGAFKGGLLSGTDADVDADAVARAIHFWGGYPYRRAIIGHPRQRLNWPARIKI